MLTLGGDNKEMLKIDSRAPAIHNNSCLEQSSNIIYHLRFYQITKTTQFRSCGNFSQLEVEEKIAYYVYVLFVLYKHPSMNLGLGTIEMALLY